MESFEKFAAEQLRRAALERATAGHQADHDRMLAQARMQARAAAMSSGIGAMTAVGQMGGYVAAAVVGLFAVFATFG